MKDMIFSETNTEKISFTRKNQPLKNLQNQSITQLVRSLNSKQFSSNSVIKSNTVIKKTYLTPSQQLRLKSLRNHPFSPDWNFTFQKQSSLQCISFNPGLQQYSIGQLLGEGAFAKVSSAIHIPTGRKVVLKTYNRLKLLKDSRTKNLTSQLSILKKLHHPNLVSYIDKIDTQTEVHIVMDYIEGKSLAELVKEKKLDQEQVKDVFRQIVEALRYCHSLNIAHRDIKLQNVLLSNGLVKIIDFGLSTCLPPKRKLNIFCGTPKYMAPEILRKRPFKGLPVDVWALGVLVYTLFVGQFPFNASSAEQLYESIKLGVFYMDERIPEEGRKLIAMMLEVNPKRRVSIKQLAKSSWL